MCHLPVLARIGVMTKREYRALRDSHDFIGCAVFQRPEGQGLIDAQYDPVRADARSAFADLIYKIAEGHRDLNRML